MELLSSPEWILTCEHAGNQVPDGYRSLFDGADKILKSHRGWDPGALELAQVLVKKEKFELFLYPYTRLFIEPNRSIGHPKLFSQFTRHLPKEKKQEVINRYYLPYRSRVTKVIKKNASKKIPTIHISVHTFTPVFDEKERHFEIGLLYDPKKTLEKDVCQNWKSILGDIMPEFRIRMNQPYKGISDGFTSFLRKLIDDKLYLGIELEMSQKLFFDNNGKWNQISLKVGESLSVLSNRLLSN